MKGETYGGLQIRSHNLPYVYYVRRGACAEPYPGLDYFVSRLRLVSGSHSVLVSRFTFHSIRYVCTPLAHSAGAGSTQTVSVRNGSSTMGRYW